MEKYTHAHTHKKREKERDVFNYLNFPVYVNTNKSCIESAPYVLNSVQQSYSKIKNPFYLNLVTQFLTKRWILGTCYQSLDKINML